MDILEKLHRDHINLSRLLDLLASTLENIESGQAPDYLLLREAIHFIAHHAEQHHHPVEDTLLRYFAGRSPTLDTLAAECEAEHRTLHGCGQEFLALIEHIANDTIVPMYELTEKLGTFIATERAHMDMEEGAIFPLLRINASAGDWADVSRLVPRAKDPLFGEQVTADYNYLYRSLCAATA